MTPLDHRIPAARPGSLQEKLELVAGHAWLFPVRLGMKTLSAPWVIGYRLALIYEDRFRPDLTEARKPIPTVEDHIILGTD